MHVKPPSVKQAGDILTVVPDWAMFVAVNSVRIKPTILVKALFPGLELNKRPFRTRFPAIIVIKPLFANRESPIPIMMPQVAPARHNLEFIADNARIAHFIVGLSTSADFDRWFLFEGPDRMPASSEFITVINSDFSFSASIAAKSPAFRCRIEKESQLVVSRLPIMAEL
jgi:hypothetical protein